jgi:hypothetical protein
MHYTWRVPIPTTNSPDRTLDVQVSVSGFWHPDSHTERIYHPSLVLYMTKVSWSFNTGCDGHYQWNCRTHNRRNRTAHWQQQFVPYWTCRATRIIGHVTIFRGRIETDTVFPLNCTATGTLNCLCLSGPKLEERTRYSLDFTVISITFDRLCGLVVIPG